MLEVLKVWGGNNYKNPHIETQRLERLGVLLRQLDFSTELIDAAHQFLFHGIINLNVFPQQEDLN